MSGAAQLYTVGYSNKPMSHFLALLASYHIKRVHDIRTVPESKAAPQFGSQSVHMNLRKVGIEYRLDGGTLGGHPKEKRLYRKDGKVNFPLLEQEPAFQNALKELAESATAPGTAIACTEKDPLDCPRFFLIGRILARQGVDVVHIKQDGSRCTQAECEQEMLAATRRGSPDLFKTPEQQLEEAYGVLMERYDHQWPT